MTKTELQLALVEGTKTNKKTAGSFLDTLGTPGQILVEFMLSVFAGARRFAHANQLCADRALQALLGMKRFPRDDTVFERILTV
jgi:hypothetical protein